jgi:hypothetical protein
MSKPITHEKALALALKLAVREMRHVQRHDFQCLGLDEAVKVAERTLQAYENDEDPS